MNNAASILALVFLAITFIQSAYDKIFYWQNNFNWINGVFSKTFIKSYMYLVFNTLIILELLAGILSCVGIIQLIVNGGRTFGFYGAVFSCISLICLLFGQRLVRDYDGARTIAIYFVPAVLAVYWLG
ncbi:MAG: DoxX family protein [Flavobacterium sp.]|nr:DoxX family protein [Flavobacterium sp.]